MCVFRTSFLYLYNIFIKHFSVWNIKKYKTLLKTNTFNGHPDFLKLKTIFPYLLVDVALLIMQDFEIPGFRLIQCVQIFAKCCNNAFILVWIFPENVLWQKKNC